MRRTWIMLAVICVCAFAPLAGAQDKPATSQQVDDLRLAVKALTDRIAALETPLKEINDLRDQVARLRQELDAMRGPAPGSRSSYYAGPGTNAPAMAHVRIDNTYFMPVDVAINGVVYQMMPGQRRYAAPLPAGTFTYEVLGIQAPVQRVLAAGETFVVSVYPR